VVTANKALIAMHGNAIFEAAHRQEVMVAFEAAVAGGIPIIKALREGLAGNRIEWLAGIINGTSNFILTEMRDRGAAFADVLGEAQRLAYAEADPAFDVEGVDAAHKLAILAAIATAFRSLRNEMRLFREHVDKRIDTQGEQLRERIDAQGKETGEQIGQLRERMARLEGLLEGLREAITGKRAA